MAIGYLSVVALIPLAAVAIRSTEAGWDGFWHAISSPQAVAALRLTLIASLIVVLINAVTGTMIAWVPSVTSSPARESSTRWSTCRSRSRRSSPA